MTTHEFGILIITLSFVFTLYKDRGELRNFLQLIYNSLPLLISLSVTMIGILFIAISPFIFQTDLLLKGNSISHAYGLFILAIGISITCFVLSVFFYKEYRDPKTKVNF